jgi:hypothetical protein
MKKVDVRNYSEQDSEYLAECLSHQPEKDPRRWTDGGLQVLYDEDGNRLFVKVEQVVRLHILHDPALRKRDAANLILQGGIKIGQALKQCGFKQMIFESKAAPLIRFTGKLLGFSELKDNYMAVL